MVVGDAKVPIRLDVQEDISDQTEVLMLYEKPVSKSTGSWTAVLSGTQIVTYIVGATDIDEEGIWGFQAKVTQPGGKVRRTWPIVKVNIHKQLA